MLVRGGGPSSGYVSTGFFGGKLPLFFFFFFNLILFYLKSGLTLGRVILFPITDKVKIIFLSLVIQRANLLMDNTTAWSR